MMSYKKLLLSNEAWVQEKLGHDKDYFREMARDQTPEFLWIGCSDSRVPAEQITGAQPGEIFVHRNIANLVIHTDLNSSSVITYAVEFLKVKHIIVCGHYGCGGVTAALGNRNFRILNKWLRHIKDTYVIHESELDALKGNEQARLNRLIELNVTQQVVNLARSEVIQRAWRERQAPLLHGWVYGMEDGRLKSLSLVEPGEVDKEIYRYESERAQ